MNKVILQKLRTGLAEKRFTLTEVANQSRIPLTTLADMRNEDWSKKTLDNLEHLKSALEILDPDEDDEVIA